MKILFKIMLAFLVALSVTAAVVVVLYINRGGGDDDAQIGDYSSGDAAEEPDSAEIEREWRRAMVEPDGLKYWHHYPGIPDDTKPGDTVVLSASANGFVAWETDPTQAYVEFFDQSSDGDTVYASFVMPDEEVIVRVLYEDAFLSNNESREQGAPIVRAAFVTPEDGLPDGMLGVPYSATLFIDGVDSRATWEVVGPEELKYTPAPGLRLSGSGTSATISSAGAVEPMEVNRHSFVIRLKWPAPTEDDPELIASRDVPLSIRIWARPEINLIGGFTEGMVGELYTKDNLIEATNVPDGIPTGMEWDVVVRYDLSPDLDLFVDNNDPRIASIGSVGLDVNNPRPLATVKTYTLKVKLSNTGSGIFADDIISDEIEITILPRPEFELARPMESLNVDDPPRFYDSIVGWRLDPSNDTGVNRVTVTGDGLPFNAWMWEQSGLPTSPEGFHIGASTPTPNTAWLHGMTDINIDTVIDQPFIIRLVATGEAPPNISGATISNNFVIRIWPRPLIAQPDPLPYAGEPLRMRDGMDGSAASIRYPGKEPEDIPYGEMLLIQNTEKLPSTAKWDMNFSKNDSENPIPPGLEPKWPDDIPLLNDRSFATLVGIPTEPSETPYSIIPTVVATDANPNINGAAYSRIFNLRIWERRYAYISIAANATSGFVSQYDNEGIFEASKVQPGDAKAPLYMDRRAVMPGTRCAISTIPTVGFMRWEIYPNCITYDPANPNAGDDHRCVYYNHLDTHDCSASNNITIGARHIPDDPKYGRTGFGITPNGLDSYVIFDMPGFRPGTNQLIDGDVHIRGVHTSPPDWTPPSGDSVLLPGTVGVELSRDISVLPGDLGLGPKGVRWELVSGELPPGLVLEDTGAFLTVIRGTPLAPPRQGEASITYTFTIALNLRGTMRLDRTLSIQIDPVPGILLGDLNGNGRRDLADLVMLAWAVGPDRDPNEPLPFPLEAADINGNGRLDSGDLRMLALLFAQNVDIPPLPPPEE